MPKQSAGLLLYRQSAKHYEVLLVHPGGPFWAKKDRGAWSIPKGEYAEGEDILEAAKREFSEETGGTPPSSGYQDLGGEKQPSGKLVHIWAVAGDFDLKNFKSNTFELEWPLKHPPKVEIEAALEKQIAAVFAPPKAGLKTRLKRAALKILGK